MPQFAVTRSASGNGTSPDMARTKLKATDLLDWSSLNVANRALLSFITEPVTGARYVPVATQGGAAGAITHPLDLVRLTQGPLGGWSGNFPPNEALLFTNDRPPPVQDPLKESIVIHFQQPVRGVGLQYQGATVTPSATGRFKANLILWNLDRSDWGQPDHAVGGVADAEAVFLGAVAANRVVSTVQIYVDAMNGQQIDFAIGRVSIVV